MSKKSKNYRTSFRRKPRYELLEKKQLLAGDFASGIISAVDTGVCDQCDVQAAEICSLEVEEVDQALEAALGNDSELDPGLEDGNEQSAAENGAESAENELTVDNETVDPRNLDLSDSMDGFFGTISPESPSETLTFTASADGTANVVVASAFERSELVLTATTADGSEIEFETVSGGPFDSVSFEVEQGETYELTISSTEPDTDGQFQLTVGFEDFVDQHADVAGAESTDLIWADNQADLTGKLETPGDIDTFKAIAPASGEVILELNELEEDKRLDLKLAVTGANGELIAEGSTNELLQISFDVTQSQEFFVAVEGGEGQKGDYQFSLSLEPIESAVVDDVVDVGDQAVDDNSELPGIDSEVVEVDAEDLTEDLSQELAAGSTDDNPIEAPEVVVIGEESDEDDPLGEVVGNQPEDEGVVDEVAPVEDGLADYTANELVDSVADLIEEVNDFVDNNAEELSDLADLVDAEVDGIVDGIVDTVTDLVEDELAVPLEEIEDAVDQVIDELDELAEVQEAIDEVLGDVDESASQVIDIVVPGDEVAQKDPVVDGAANETEESDVAQDGALVVDTVEADAEAEEDDRELVCIFGSDSVDLFFESLSQARDEFHGEFADGFGDWTRGFWYGVNNG